jgi:hypothetical protein
MRRIQSLALLIACAAAGGLPATGCGGAVEPGNGGYGGGGSSSGSGSSSGPTGPGTSSSSSGGPAPSPECAGLPVPSVAASCPDGTSVGGYYVWDGMQCVLSFSCPMPGQPVPTPTPPGPFPGPFPTPYPAPYPGGSSSSSGGPAPSPTPPACNFALPNICEACSNGETICAHYAIQNGTCVVEICPPTYVSPPMPVPPQPGGACSQGAACFQGEGCASTSPAGTYACSNSCNCDYTGHYQCTQNCPPPPPPYPYPMPYPNPGPSGCTQGAACPPNSGCGGGPDQYGCYDSCTCDYYGTLQCTYSCPAYDAGVAD